MSLAHIHGDAVYEMSTSTYLAYFLFPKIRVSFHARCKLAGACALIQSSTFKSVKTVSLSFLERTVSERGIKGGNSRKNIQAKGSHDDAMLQLHHF